jgi:hypothetical protein
MPRSLCALLLIAFVVCGPALAQKVEPEPTTRELRVLIDEADKRYNQRFDAQEKAVAAALAAAKEAVVKAEAASEKRFDSVNEFRATLKDQQTLLIPRTEVDAKLKALSDRLDDVDARTRTIAGRIEAVTWVWGVVIGIGGLAIGAAGIFIRRRDLPRKA